MVPSFRRHYTTAVKNAIRRTDTVYLERVVAALRRRGQAVADDLLAHLSPLG